MRLIITMGCLLLCFNLKAQDSTAVSTDSTESINPEELGKLERKVYDLEKKIEEAMADREKLREVAHASSEPEAYSKVATASIKISKIQEKLRYAQYKLNLSRKKDEKKQKKAQKKNNSP